MDDNEMYSLLRRSVSYFITSHSQDFEPCVCDELLDFVSKIYLGYIVQLDKED